MLKRKILLTHLEKTRLKRPPIKRQTTGLKQFFMDSSYQYAVGGIIALTIAGGVLAAALTRTVPTKEPPKPEIAQAAAPTEEVTAKEEVAEALPPRETHINPVTACSKQGKTIVGPFVVGVKNDSSTKVNDALDLLRDKVKEIIALNLGSVDHATAVAELGAQVQACVKMYDGLEVLFTEQLGRIPVEADYSNPANLESLAKAIAKARIILKSTKEAKAGIARKIESMCTGDKTLIVVFSQSLPNNEIRGKAVAGIGVCNEGKTERSISTNTKCSTLSAGDKACVAKAAASTIEPANALPTLYGNTQSVTNPAEGRSKVFRDALATFIEKRSPTEKKRGIPYVPIGIVFAVITAVLALVSRPAEKPKPARGQRESTDDEDDSNPRPRTRRSRNNGAQTNQGSTRASGTGGPQFTRSELEEAVRENVVFLRGRRVQEELRILIYSSPGTPLVTLELHIDETTQKMQLPNMGHPSNIICEVQADTRRIKTGSFTQSVTDVTRIVMSNSFQIYNDQL